MLNCELRGDFQLSDCFTTQPLGGIAGVGMYQAAIQISRAYSCTAQRRRFGNGHGAWGFCDGNVQVQGRLSEESIGG